MNLILTQQKILYANDPDSIYMAVEGPRNANGDDPLRPTTTINGWTIRVHMKALGHPLLGDTLYHDSSSMLSDGQPAFYRTALHAWKVTFRQPFEGNKITLTGKLPEDFLQVASYSSG